MKAYTWTENGFTFKRINKTQARRAYNNGLRVVVCPVNLRPGYPWHPEIIVSGKSGTTFNEMLNAFIYYNIRDNETGKYPAFYTQLRRWTGSREKSPRRERWERLNNTPIVLWRVEKWAL